MQNIKLDKEQKIKKQNAEIIKKYNSSLQHFNKHINDFISNSLLEIFEKGQFNII